MVFKSYSNGGLGGGAVGGSGGRRDPVKFVSQIKDENLGMGEKVRISSSGFTALGALGWWRLMIRSLHSPITSPSARRWCTSRTRTAGTPLVPTATKKSRTPEALGDARSAINLILTLLIGNVSLSVFAS